MSSTKSLLLLLLSYVSTCLGGIVIRTSDPVESKFTEATVHILSSCYKNRATPVGLAGTSAGIISEALWSQEASPVTLIDGTSRIVNNGPVHPNTRYKLQVFVVAASSAATLTEVLGQIKASVWWNHMASFLILDWPPSNHDCSNAHEILWTAWVMNILNAKFMCNHRTNGRLIYTFNPFTSRAPEPWLFDKTHRGINNHPWTLFVREYQKDNGVCNELDFEKTNDLGGYEIRVLITNTFYRTTKIRENKTFEAICFDPRASEMCSIIFPALKATPKVFLRTGAGSLGYVKRGGNISGILGEVASGSSDLGMNGRYLATVGNLTSSYPFTQSSMHALTQYTGYKSQLSKIRSVIDAHSRYGLYLVVLTTILFFKFFLRKSLTVAHLDTFRIICNSCLPDVPTNAAPRIYLAGLFLFALTLQGIFQGRLASLITNPQALRNVDTMKDLAELGHTIYGFPGYGMFFGDSAFQGRYRASSGQKQCTGHVRNNAEAACVSGKSIITHEASKHNLHVSREALVFNHVILPIRPDWPLEARLNSVLMRATQANLKAHLTKLAMYRTERIIKIREQEYVAESVKVMTFEQLRFAFVILCIGLGVAGVTFVVEVGLGRMRLRIHRMLDFFYYRDE